MKKDKNITEEDIKLFRETVARMKTIPGHKLSPHGQPVKIAIPTSLTDCKEPQIKAEDYLLFKRPGIQDRVLKQLRQGKLEPAATLDLHRLTVEQAKQQLFEFLANTLKQSYRIIRIVHGKGLNKNNIFPTLKNQVNHWLPQIPAVLAFCSASPRQGGTGAVLVLLKQIDFNKKINDI